MAKERNWTSEDDACLAEKWGNVAIPTLCKSLNRSKKAILQRVHRLELGAFLQCGSYVSFSSLLDAIGCKDEYSSKRSAWIEKRGLPVKTKKVCDCRFKVVYLADFWRWAEQNRAYLDLSKIEKNVLGAEPAWVEGQRQLDFAKQQKYPTPPWTPAEDQLLLDLLKQQRYGYLELSKRMGRTCGAIQRRVCNLGTKYRPVKAYNHDGWMTDELSLVCESVKLGYGYDLMAERVGRSSKALRGLMYRVYHTEKLDTVMGLLGNGKWGDGAPALTVKDGKRLVPVKNDLRRLSELLLMRRNALAFGGYWQKELCALWHPVKGCTAGETDCDSCSGFRRIREQYCRRCGATIISRTEAHLCERCKQGRKKQAQRKWAILNAKEG